MTNPIGHATRIDAIKELYSRKLGERDEMLRRLKMSEDKSIDAKARVKVKIRARDLVNVAAALTQSAYAAKAKVLLQYAFSAIYERPMEVEINLTTKANKPVAEIYVIGASGMPEKPKTEMGGGVLDILSFALRVLNLRQEGPNLRPFLVLDEPMKFVGRGEMLQKSSAMVTSVSENKNYPVQIMVITHLGPAFTMRADKVYEVTHNGIHSKVKLQGEVIKAIPRIRA